MIKIVFGLFGFVYFLITSLYMFTVPIEIPQEREACGDCPLFIINPFRVRVPQVFGTCKGAPPRI